MSESDNTTDTGRREELLGTPSCRIPLGEFTDEDIETLKERRRKALEKYGYETGEGQDALPQFLQIIKESEVREYERIWCKNDA